MVACLDGLPGWLRFARHWKDESDGVRVHKGAGLEDSLSVGSPVSGLESGFGQLMVFE